MPQLVRESLPLYNPLTWVVAPLCQDLGDIDEEKPPRDDGTLWCPEVEWTDTRFGPVEELLHAAAQLRLKQAGIKFISSEQQEDWYKGETCIDSRVCNVCAKMCVQSVCVQSVCVQIVCAQIGVCLCADEVSSILPISDSSMIYERMGGMFEELPMPASEVQDSMELRPDQSYLRRPPRRRPARLYKISISNNAMHELTAREYDEGVAGMNVLRRHVSGRYVVDFLPFESDGNPGKQPDAVETTEVGMQTSEPPRPKSAARPKKKVWAQFKHANTITVVELKNKKGESALSEKQWENKYKEWATLATCPPVSLPRPSWTEELERRLFVEDRETPIKLDEKREREFLHKQQLWKQAKEKVRERIEEWDADMNARLIQPLKVVDAEERQKWAGDYDADDLHHTLRATAFRRCRGGRRFLHRFERDTTWPPIETRVPPPDPRPDIDPARLRNPSQGVFVPNKAHSLRHPGAVMRGRPRPKER